MSRHAIPQTVHAAITETRLRSVLTSHLDGGDLTDAEDGVCVDGTDDVGFSQSTRRTLESDCDDAILTCVTWSVKRDDYDFT